MSLAFARLLRYGRPRRLGSLCSSYPSLRSSHSPQPATLIRTLKTTRQLSNKDNSNIPERTQDLTSENENESKLTPDELAAELTKAGVKQHLSDLDQFREDLPSIAKCILTGDFPLKVLSFPDVLPNDRYFSLQRRCESIAAHFERKSKLLSEIDSSGSVSQDLLLPLRNLDVYGLDAPTEIGGQGLGITETLKVLEELASSNLSLSQRVSDTVLFGHRAVERFGTPEAKEKYLKGILDGTIPNALCFCDPESGSDPMTTNVMLKATDSPDTFTLNGTKTWVSNATHAKVFTVFAKQIKSNFVGETVPTILAVLVDRHAPGVTVGPPMGNKAGLRGLDVCEVRFEDVKIPKVNFLGTDDSCPEILTDLVLGTRLYQAGQMAASMRKLLSLTVKHCLSRRSFNYELSHFDLIKHHLGTMASMLYALESMIYMTAGLADVQANKDYHIESNMCKLFAIQTARLFAEKCQLMYGAESYRTDSPVFRICQDLRAFEFWEGSADLITAYIGTAGAAWVAECQEESVLHMRNPSKYPFRFLQDRIQRYRHSIDRPKMTLAMNEHVHPSLVSAADNTEYCIHRILYAVELTIARNGKNLQTREIQLMRISDAATWTYAMVSALARASRSYSCGHYNGDHEVALAIALCSTGREEVTKAVNNLMAGPYGCNDFYYMDVADYMFEKGEYAPVHPTTKVTF